MPTIASGMTVNMAMVPAAFRSFGNPFIASFSTGSTSIIGGPPTEHQ
jgi:hypothetical protein